MRKVPLDRGIRKVALRKVKKTTDSLAKLAKESLDVGSLLGVKVCANEEAALKRITVSLKKERKAGFNEKNKLRFLNDQEVQWMFVCCPHYVLVSRLRHWY